MRKIALIMVCIILCTTLVSCAKKGPPNWVQFYSFEGIQEYVSSVNWKTRTYQYDSSRTTYNIFQKISYRDAQKSVKDITKTVIPRVKKGVEVESFSASYYMGFTEPFQIKYRIDGNMYVFTYSYYGAENKIYGEEMFQKKIGSKTLTLYYIRGIEGCLEGVVQIGKTEIQVRAYGDDHKCLHLDYFDFVKISP